MKYSSALVAAATFGLSSAWDKDAPSYSTPDNTDTKCNSQQQNGYTFGGVPEGPISHYGGFKLGGFDCKNTNYKRTFDSYDHNDSKAGQGGYGKCIAGAAKPGSGPSMESPDHDFSIHKMHLSTEYDTPIECHYSMPSGETCKETHDCSSKGTTIENSQCGGAKHLSIALPKEHKSKSCQVSVHSVGFHCGHASVSSYPATSATPSSYATPSTPAYSTPSAPVYSSTPSAPVYSSTPKGYATPSSPKEYPTPSSPKGYPTPSSPQKEYPSSTPENTPSSPAGYSTPAGSTPSSPAGYAPPPKSSEHNSPERSTGHPEHPKPSVYTTTTSCSSGQVITATHTKAVTSTITEVETHTITSCAKTVTNCPAHKKTVTKVTTATPGQEYTTTLHKATVITHTVTATRSPKPSSYPHGPVPEQPSTPNKPHGAPEGPKPSSPKGTTCPPGYKVSPKHGSPYVINQPPTVQPGHNGPSGGTSPAPAPKALPRCLNTFQAPKCKGNTDSDCYCNNSEYVTNVINCAVAHGESNEEAAKAISYLQGICVKHISNCPALVTAVPKTITVSPVPKGTQAPSYTTVPLPKYSTTLTVPKVEFVHSKGSVGLQNYGSSSPTQAPAPYGGSSPAGASAAPSAAAPGAPGAPAAPAGPAGTPATGTSAPTYASGSKKASYTGAANKNAIGGGVGAAAGFAALLML